MDKIFLVYIQTISHTVDVIEIADHLGGIVDSLIREAMLA